MIGKVIKVSGKKTCKTKGRIERINFCPIRRRAKPKCHFCCKTKDLMHTVDPYEEAMSDDKTLIWICYDCHWDRSQDI